MKIVIRTLAILGLLIGLASLASSGEFVSKSMHDLNPNVSMTELHKRPQVVSLSAASDVHVMTSLNLDELVAIEVPKDFDFAKKLGWSFGVLLHPGEYRARVPIYGYKRDDVCFGTVESRSLLDRIETGTELIQGALVLAFDGDQESWNVNWHETVEEACADSGTETDSSTDRIDSAVIDTLSEHLAKSVSTVSDDVGFLLTTIPLRNVDVIGEYIGVCNTEENAREPGSICYARLDS